MYTYIYTSVDTQMSRQLRVKKHKSVETAFIKNETKLGHVDGQWKAALQFFFDCGGEITSLSFRRYAQEVDNGLG